MSYLSRENSEAGGAPIELYQFMVGAETFTFTSGDTETVFQFETYKRAPLVRSNVKLGGESAQSKITLTSPKDFEIARMFNGQAPSKRVWLTIWRVHRGETEPRHYWHGRVLTVDFVGQRATIQCSPVDDEMKRPGLRAHYQPTCNHLLYSLGCGLNAETYRVLATITYAQGDVIKAVVFGTRMDGHFKAGFVQRISNNDFRDVTAHSGDALTLLAPFAGLQIGEQVWAYPGCEHDINACANTAADPDKWGDNTDNMDAYPKVPKDNPFEEGIE